MPQTSENISELKDTELLERHLGGDQQAFATLMERYRVELFNFLARFIGDATLADDVFQETFLQLHLSAATFDLERNLKPWLFTIAANKARDALRTRGRRHAVPLDAAIAGSENGRTSYGDLIPANIPQPDESMLNLETRQAVETIVKEMPENLRTILLLNYFHEFSYKDIADMLDVPLGTVKSRLHAAVRHFAKRWKAAAERKGHDESESEME